MMKQIKSGQTSSSSMARLIESFVERAVLSDEHRQRLLKIADTVKAGPSVAEMMHARVALTEVVDEIAGFDTLRHQRPMIH